MTLVVCEGWWLVTAATHTKGKNKRTQFPHSPLVLDMISNTPYVPPSREPRETMCFPVKAVRRTHVKATWQYGDIDSVSRNMVAFGLAVVSPWTWEGIFRRVLRFSHSHLWGRGMTPCGALQSLAHASDSPIKGLFGHHM
jgi:hypothetical protein